MKFSRGILLAAACGLMAVVATGCGDTKLKLVKGASLKTYTQDSDAYAELKVQIDTGSVQLPAITLPIIDPRAPQTVYGKFGLAPRFDGGADIIIDADLTAIAKVPGDGAVLPNGSQLPVGGLDGSRVIALPVAKSGAKVYAAIDTQFSGTPRSGIAMVGVAIPFKELNKLGDYLGNISLFTSFDINNVRGIAGVFTGTDSGKSGLALFVDMSSLVGPPPSESMLASSALVSKYSIASVELAEAMQQAVSPRKLRFEDIKPAWRDEREIRNALYRMHMKKSRMHLQ